MRSRCRSPLEPIIPSTSGKVSIFSPAGGGGGGKGEGEGGLYSVSRNSSWDSRTVLPSFVENFTGRDDGGGVARSRKDAWRFDILHAREIRKYWMQVVSVAAITAITWNICILA